MKISHAAVLAALLGAAAPLAAEKPTTLSGTWILDSARSDSGQQARRRIGFPGTWGGGIPGIGFPGGGYPGGYPGGGYPGGGYPRADDGMENLTLHIVQTDGEVQATRMFTLEGEDRTITQKFSLDGSENTNPASNGRGEFTSRSTWKNSRLVNLGTQSDEPLMEEYSLSKDGKVLTLRTTRTTARGERSSRQVFERQDSPQ